MAELRAGVEIDARIATEIMGWRDCQWSDFLGHGGKPPKSDKLLRGAYGMATVPNYSTDIAAAWQVHLAMCDKLFSVRNRYLEELHNLANAELKEGSIVHGDYVWDVLRNKMPESICRAALAAVEAPADGGG